MSIEWKLAEPISLAEQRRFPEIHPVVLQLLANRGITTQERIDEFLHPDYSQDVHDPSSFTKMEEVVDRIWRAMEKNEKIVIFSDYDADGVTSGTIIYTAIKEIGARLGFSQDNLDFYIPHREFEGYGMNQPAVEKLATDGANLIITTDCGISNEKEISWLRDKGVETIVIDHHQVPDKLPPALIIHTFAPGEIYPFKPLAAVSVVFKVARALFDRAREQGMDFPTGYEKWFLDLVAIATVTDMVPLVGENRTLVKYGLTVLNKTRRVGLKKLIQTTATPLGKINARAIGFQIGPRLNAASRMENGSSAFRLLITDDEKEAEELAVRLNQLNQDRQAKTQEIFEQAMQILGDVGQRKILSAANEAWPPSIVGLVAGKICDRYYCPTILIGQQSGKWFGSGRSIAELDITRLLHHAEEHLERFGGHAGACGFTLNSKDDIEPFFEKIKQKAHAELAGQKLKPKIQIDCEMNLEEADFDLAARIADFAPFGQENPMPLFFAKDLTVASFEALGTDQKHVKILVKTPSQDIKKLIGFGMADRIEELEVGASMKLVYELGVNEWNGNQELQFKIIDFKL
ncbi:single-stranded-DNA-specific exonuclease RecJ [Patescibacteria group bacterium]|nr:single-stranded-DNA-specific exonuclease RecJ [Patescibacteria group bacterium]MBU1921598.1 single-stranded-DNA-specific exonuclease RecJ [Patescibacteria group bacterium]